MSLTAKACGSEAINLPVRFPAPTGVLISLCMLCSDQKHGQFMCQILGVLPCLDPSKSFSPLPCNALRLHFLQDSRLCPCRLILPGTTQFLRNLQADKSKWFTEGSWCFCGYGCADSLQSVCLISMADTCHVMSLPGTCLLSREPAPIACHYASFLETLF